MTAANPVHVPLNVYISHQLGDERFAYACGQNQEYAAFKGTPARLLYIGRIIGRQEYWSDLPQSCD